jgi:hypothetical protein
MAVVGTWTYGGDPAANNRDAVRFLLRDTVESQAKISDEEIAWLLSENGNNVYAAAIAGADNVASSFSSQARTKTVGALSITYEASAVEYRQLAKDLRLRRIRAGGIAPYSGGISIIDKEAQESDTDWDKPFFSRGMDDNIEVVST